MSAAFQNVVWAEAAAQAAGIAATVAAYAFARKLSRDRAFRWAPPILVAAALIIAGIELTPATYEGYAEGGGIVTYLLGPATVALAYPLYQFSRLARESALEVAAATAVSAIASISTMLFLGWLFGLDSGIVKSLLPKSVTTPIALEISKITGGMPGVCVAGVFMAGTFGGAFGHAILRACGVKSDMAQGLAMGASSHVIGTAKCLEVSERQAAMSALVLVLAAVFTTLVFSVAMAF